VTSGRRAREAGFSYIEILVGILILAIVAGGIAQGIAQTSGALGSAKAETTANKIASAELDKAHRMPYEDVGIVGGSPPGVIQATQTKTVGGIAYKIETTVDYVDDPALGQPQTYVNYKKVAVTVTPQTAKGRPYTETTLIAPPAIGAIAGKATIIATVIDALTDQPVAGAPVTADQSTSPTQTRSTAADGKVVFAGLEPSAISPTDPKYKYRLTVGLPSPWVTHPDSDPSVAQQHLAASQTWPTTLRVFKKATIVANLRDSSTGQLITEFSKVRVTTPGPDVLSDTRSGTAGTFMFTDIRGKAIQPSASNFRLDVQSDCYASQTVSRPVPTGYPSNTTETFDLGMVRVPSGYLDVTVRSTAPGNPVIPNAQVQVSGGQANISPRVRDVNAAGFVRFCLEPSGSVSYVVSAAVPGYGAGSVLANVQQGQTTTLTLLLNKAANLGNVRLDALASGRLVRLRALSGTYDASQVTNDDGYADFTGLAAGDYMAYIATGFSGGNPTWSTGKVVKAFAGAVTTYTVP
jgi:type II secretory pathway pseudopilin PulG